MWQRFLSHSFRPGPLSLRSAAKGLVCGGAVTAGASQCLRGDATAFGPAAKGGGLSLHLRGARHALRAGDGVLSDVGPTSGFYAYDPDQERALLGTGSYGEVYRVRGGFEGEPYAVKLFRDSNKDWRWRDVRNEAQRLVGLNHQHVLRYFTAFEIPPGGEFRAGLVTELCTGGSLAERVRDPQEREPDVVGRRLSQLARGLRYLHDDAGIVHLDIKASNVLIQTPADTSGSAADCIKIADLGQSAPIAEARRQSATGSDMYLPPEFYSGGGMARAGPQFDMWAAGCVLSEMVTGTFVAERMALLSMAGIGGFGVGFAQSPGTVKQAVAEVRAASEPLGRIAARLLEPDPARRMTARELVGELEERHCERELAELRSQVKALQAELERARGGRSPPSRARRSPSQAP